MTAFRKVCGGRVAVSVRVLETVKFDHCLVKLIKRAHRGWLHAQVFFDGKNELLETPLYKVLEVEERQSMRHRRPTEKSVSCLV